MKFLLDTNVIIRFLTGDNEKLYKESINILKKIEEKNIEVLILDGVLAESVYVLEKFYEQPKNTISKNLKEIIMLDGVINNNKLDLIESLSLYSSENIDFVDCLIISMCNISGYRSLSFDKKVNKLIN